MLIFDMNIADALALAEARQPAQIETGGDAALCVEGSRT